ncbi:MAG: YecA family protein [Gammaproteobacteria bacterium]|nr:YecA family protein [Gammaproteobacteria bacterium]
MSSETDIEQIKRDLVRLGNESSPFEAHGMLCGVLCAKGDIDAEEWLSLTMDGFAAIAQGDLLAEEASESLRGFFLDTVAALADNHFKFYPLLPEDESEMLRLEAVAQWAQGYLLGLSLAGIQHFSDYSPDVVEFVETMASISNADNYELADDESDEEAIIELIEFMRIGVLLVNEEMNPIRVPVDIPDGTIH